MTWKALKKKYRDWKQFLDFCIDMEYANQYHSLKMPWKKPSTARVTVEVLWDRLWHHVLQAVCRIKGHDWEEDDTYLEGRGCGRVDITCQRCFEHHGGYW